MLPMKSVGEGTSLPLSWFLVGAGILGVPWLVGALFQSLPELSIGLFSHVSLFLCLISSYDISHIGLRVYSIPL